MCHVCSRSSLMLSRSDLSRLDLETSQTDMYHLKSRPHLNSNIRHSVLLKQLGGTTSPATSFLAPQVNVLPHRAYTPPHSHIAYDKSIINFCAKHILRLWLMASALSSRTFDISIACLHLVDRFALSRDRTGEFVVTVEYSVECYCRQVIWNT